MCFRIILVYFFYGKFAITVISYICFVLNRLLMVPNDIENNFLVLCVDNDPDFLFIQKELLAKEKGFVVETAISVKDALDLLDKKRFDVIVSDYQMPITDGLQFLESLRKSGNNIPFIVLTGKSREEIVIKSLNLGADRYIRKGIDTEAMNVELINTIKTKVNCGRRDSL